MPPILYYMKWIFPLSVLWFLLTAVAIPAYENRLFYFLSISSVLLVALNSLVSWISGFYLSLEYSNKSGRTLRNLALALVLNVWGQYTYHKKLKSVVVRKSVSAFELFYAFFLFIIGVISHMMSAGVGNGS